MSPRCNHRGARGLTSILVCVTRSLTGTRAQARRSDTRRGSSIGHASLGLTLGATLFALAVGLTVAYPATAAAVPGDIAWLRVFDDPGHGADAFLSSAPAPNGGVYAVGDTARATLDLLVARYDAAGQRRWIHAVDGPGQLTDYLQGATTDASGDLVAVGNVDNISSVVVKYAPNGARKWLRVYAEPAAMRVSASLVAVDHAGAIYVAGYRVLSTQTDIVLIKYSPRGSRLWVRHYLGGGKSSGASDIALDGAGNVYLGGSHVSASGAADILALSYDPTGHRRWATRWDGPGGGTDVGRAIAVDGAGSTYVAGSTQSVSSGLDAVVVKFGPRGGLKWSRTTTSPGVSDDNYADIATTGNGDVVAAGLLGINGRDALIVRLSPSGGTRWTRSYDDPEHSADFATNVGVAKSGNIFLTGSTSSSATSWDVLALAYNGAGGRRWATPYVGAGANDQQVPMGLVVNGGAYVVGFQDGNGQDAVLVKFRP